MDEFNQQQGMGAMGLQGGEPQSPPDMGGGMEPPTEVEMATSEEKQQLLMMIDQVRQKMRGVEAVRFAHKNNVKMFQAEVLKKLFDILLLAGVDLSKRESVSAFLEKLRSNNPELAQWFEESMDVLLTPQEGGEEPSLIQGEESDLVEQGGEEEPQNENENIDYEEPSENDLLY